MFTFKSGTTLQGEVVEFKGTNSVVVKSSADGKPYTIALSDLSPSSLARLAKLRSMAGTKRKAASGKLSGPWENDAGWQSCEAAIQKLGEQHSRLNQQRSALYAMRRAKQGTKENSNNEANQIAALDKQLSRVGDDLSKQEAQQRRIEAGYRLREVNPHP
jgi:hypothetical protein